MADYVPLFPCEAHTSTTSASVTGGTLVAVSGSGTVATAGANAINWVGIAGFDAPSGAIVTVHRGGVQRIVNSGGVTAGDSLVCAASGQVSTLAAVTTPTAADVTNTRARVGIALTTATTGNLVEVLMER
jgi:uncharacterized protein DUF2190